VKYGNETENLVTGRRLCDAVQVGGAVNAQVQRGLFGWEFVVPGTLAVAPPTAA